MTVGAHGAGEGELLSVVRETPVSDGRAEVSFGVRRGIVHADLLIVDGAAALKLRANLDVFFNGVMLAGSGFIVSPEQAVALGLGKVKGLDA